MTQQDNNSPEVFHAYLVRLHNLTPKEAVQWDTEYIIAATSFHFPRDTWGNSAVTECIRLLVTAERLQQELSTVAVRREGKYWISPSHDEVYKDADVKRHEVHSEEEQGFRPAHALTIVRSYALAEVLMRCVVAMLHDGVNGDTFSRDYLQGKANAALRAYGLRVEYDAHEPFEA